MAAVRSRSKGPPMAPPHRPARPGRSERYPSANVGPPTALPQPAAIGANEQATGLSKLALMLVLVASFMVVLDFSIVNVALPSIRHDLGFGGDSVQWVVTAYAITFGGLLILGEVAIADTFGRRALFVVGLLVFAGSSLAAGLTDDAVLLVAARGLQGIGAASRSWRGGDCRSLRRALPRVHGVAVPWDCTAPRPRSASWRGRSSVASS